MSDFGIMRVPVGPAVLEARRVGWSIAVMAIDLLVIFGLWAYGLHRPARRAA